MAWFHGSKPVSFSIVESSMASTVAEEARKHRRFDQGESILELRVLDRIERALLFPSSAPGD